MTARSGINWHEFTFPPVNLYSIVAYFWRSEQIFSDNSTPQPHLRAMQEAQQRKTALEQQVDGDHYKKLGEYQPYCVLNRWMTPEELKGFAKGSAIAYLAREADKGGRTDIEKAVHHLQLYLTVTKENT